MAKINIFELDKMLLDHFLSQIGDASYEGFIYH